MNNGQYVGPIISRKSPRWRMLEILPTSFGFAAGNQTVLFMEPYIPPTVNAVMVTATAAGNSSGTSNNPASCHNLVFPLKDRRFFVETSNQGVRLFLVHEADLLGTAGAAILANAEIAIYLNPTSISGGNAIVYSRNTTQFTVASDTTLSFLNGVIAAGISSPNQLSLIDPRLRRSGTGTLARLNPGNIQWPVRSSAGTVYATPGSASVDATATYTGNYVRLEYLL